MSSWGLWGLHTAADEDYRDSHQAPDAESGAPMHDVTQGIYPASFYDEPFNYYGSDEDTGDRDGWHTIHRVRGNPNARVRIHRALPLEYTKRERGIGLSAPLNTGDWVTPSYDYAHEHGESRFGDNIPWTVVTSTAPASQLHTSGDSLAEWGYNGPATQGYEGSTAAGKRKYRQQQLRKQQISAETTKDFHHCGFCGSPSGVPCERGCWGKKKYPGERDVRGELPDTPGVSGGGEIDYDPDALRDIRLSHRSTDGIRWGLHTAADGKREPFNPLDDYYFPDYDYGSGVDGEIDDDDAAQVDMGNAWLIGEGSTRRKPHIQRGVEQGPAHPDAPLTDTERWLQNTGHEFAKRIYQAEPNTDHLYRGMTVPPEWVDKARQDGSVTLPLSSFSADPSLAYDYSRPDPGRTWSPRRGHSVILRVEPGSKSHPIADDEDVSHGDFDVLNIHSMTDDELRDEYAGSPKNHLPTTVFHLRQRSVPPPFNSHTASTDGIRYARHIGITSMHPDDVENYTAFANPIYPEKLPELKRSIERNGITTPLVIQTDGERAVLADGHHRLMAAQELGLDQVPVVIDHNYHQFDDDDPSAEGAVAEYLRSQRLAHIVEADVAEDLQRAYEQRNARTAMPAPAPANLRFKVHPDQHSYATANFDYPYTVDNYPVVTAHLGDDPTAIGHLEWFGDPKPPSLLDGVRRTGNPGEVAFIHVREPYRRHDIATTMFDWVKDNVEPRLHHSDERTGLGRQWIDHEQSRRDRLDDRMLAAVNRNRRGARTAAEDPTDLFVQRLRDLNHRHRIHTRGGPVPDRVIAQYPPLSVQEEDERQKLLGLQTDLNRRWDDMAPMTDDEVALHTRLNPMAHQHDDLENLPDRRKARYFADLSNPQFLQGGPRTRREQHHYDTLQPWADQYFGGMQAQARNDLKRWDDYHAKGYHWNGNSTLEGDEEAHALHNTADWGAEMTRPTIDPTPVRKKLETSQFLMLRNHADAHRQALEEMAAHGPLHYSPDRHRNTYAYQNVEDSRNRLHVELQHRKVFTPLHLDELPKVAHPKEAHAEGMLVNPRHHDGLTPGAIYEQYAEQRAFKINCQRCVLAAEARHRGYNVEAARNYQPVEGVKNHPDNDQEFGDHDIAAWFTDPSTGRPPRWQDAEDLPDPTWQPDDLSDLTDKQREQFLRGVGGAQQPTKVRDNPDLHHWDAMHDHITSWGPGARGIVAVTYKSASGATKRHVLSAHVRDDGTVHYFDPQDGSTGQEHEWRDRVDYAGSRDDHWMARDNAAQNPIKGIGTTIHNKYYSPLRVLRVDNQDLHPSVAHNVVSRGTAPDEPLRPVVDAGTRN